MAKDILTRLIKSERNATPFLPYARHADRNVLVTDNGDLVAVFEVLGRAFETADHDELFAWHEALNNAWRTVAADKVAIFVHTVRSRTDIYPSGVFRSAFGEGVDAAYKDRISRERLFTTRHFLTVVLRKSVDGAAKAATSFVGFLSGQKGQDGAEADRMEQMTELLRSVEQLVRRLAPRLLTTYEHEGLLFSEPLECFQHIMTGRFRRIPIVRGHLGSALYADRFIFGRETIEFRSPGGSRFAGILGVREHAARTVSGQLNALVRSDFEFVLSQSFCFLAKSAAIETTRRRQGQMAAVDDAAVSQAIDLNDAMDDLQSGRFALGEHQLCLMIVADDPRGLSDALSAGRAALSETGVIAVREDLALEAAYWSQLPGNFAYRPRPAAISTRNFAALAPFHSYPVGRPTGNHWGDAVAMLKTTANSPYYFNFHVRDVGHTLIIGPTGSGKTVLQNFLLSQSEKLGARIVFFDKDRGAEIFVRAAGGSYLALQNGKSSRMAPLKALEHSPDNFDWLLGWLRMLVSPSDGSGLAPRDLEALTQALQAVGRQKLSERNLRGIREQLPQNDLDGMAARLDRWVSGGELGWVFDNDADELELDAQFVGFDMTNFLDNDAVRPPLMSYLFYRIDRLISAEDAADKQPVIIDIDEFWKVLADESFSKFTKDGLKTYRKRNAMFVFGTQSPSDALSSSIASTIIGQCPTLILLPNVKATPEEYMQGLHLTKAEFEAVKYGMGPDSRRVLIKQDTDSVIVELDLDGMDDELAVLSGRDSTVSLLDDLRRELGDDPAVWLPEFHRRRKLPGSRNGRGTSA